MDSLGYLIWVLFNYTGCVWYLDEAAASVRWQLYYPDGYEKSKLDGTFAPITERWGILGAM